MGSPSPELYVALQHKGIGGLGVMTDDEVAAFAIRFYSSLFPRECQHCGQRFSTLRQWIETTTPLRGAMSFDAEEGEWAPPEPLGTVVFANCPCGDTLALTTDRAALEMRHRLLDWIRVETARRGISASELIDSIREKVGSAVLRTPGL
jgi:hypothetical protein